MNEELKVKQNMLFKSENNLDWASRESWVRRACFWKLMAMGLESTNRCTDPNIKGRYEAGLGADLICSPDMEAIKSIESYAVPAFNSRNKKR